MIGKENETQERGLTIMINGYYYGTPMLNYVNDVLVLGIAAVAAAVLGVVLFFTFFRKKNEGKFTGWKGKLYHFMNFNRFYAEDILRFVYIVAACVATVVGIVTIILGSFLVGITELIGLNLLLRIGFELIMMFIILCRKTVSMDRKLDRISKYYDDGYEADCMTQDTPSEWDEEASGADCASCDPDTADCAGCAGEDLYNEIQEAMQKETLQDEKEQGESE